MFVCKALGIVYIRNISAIILVSLLRCVMTIKMLNSVVSGVQYTYKDINLRLSVLDLFVKSRNKREIFEFANDLSRELTRK